MLSGIFRPIQRVLRLQLRHLGRTLRVPCYSEEGLNMPLRFTRKLNAMVPIPSPRRLTTTWKLIRKLLREKLNVVAGGCRRLPSQIGPLRWEMPERGV